jgi:hypothetical protein
MTAADYITLPAKVVWPPTPWRKRPLTAWRAIVTTSDGRTIEVTRSTRKALREELCDRFQ